VTPAQVDRSIGAVLVRWPYQEMKEAERAAWRTFLADVELEDFRAALARAVRAGGSTRWGARGARPDIGEMAVLVGAEKRRRTGLQPNPPPDADPDPAMVAQQIAAIRAIHRRVLSGARG